MGNAVPPVGNPVGNPVQPSPVPTNPHHQPTSQPTPTPSDPKPFPKLMPTTAVGAAVALSTSRVTRYCPTPKSYQVEKDFPKKNPSPAQERGTARKRPCGEDDPIITYTRRRRFLGTIAIPKKLHRMAGSSPERDLDQGVKRLIKEKGYKIGKKLDVEVDGPRKPKTKWERLRPHLSGAGSDCIYDVYVIEKRRVCKCPDGSKCNKTRSPKPIPIPTPPTPPVFNSEGFFKDILKKWGIGDGDPTTGPEGWFQPESD